MIQELTARRLRVYPDTSVIGGCFDVEFAAESQALIRLAIEGRAILVISGLLLAELADAPPAVQGMLDSLPAEATETFAATVEADRLHQAYLAAGVVGPASANDALHVATATVARADMIVSWNFRHIVHFERIRGYNAVNVAKGYAPIAIHSPREVI
jgi:predicted nucleic acid-binding protein